jgi:hypothetical protein
MSQKFQPGDHVAFLWGALETHHGTVKKYHGNPVGLDGITYSVEDHDARWSGVFANTPVVRFLYEHEMTLDTEAKSANA